jgi:hypothetical protein
VYFRTPDLAEEPTSLKFLLCSASSEFDNAVKNPGGLQNVKEVNQNHVGSVETTIFDSEN